MKEECDPSPAEKLTERLVIHARSGGDTPITNKLNQWLRFGRRPPPRHRSPANRGRCLDPSSHDTGKQSLLIIVKQCISFIRMDMQFLPFSFGVSILESPRCCQSVSTQNPTCTLPTLLCKSRRIEEVQKNKVTRSPRFVSFYIRIHTYSSSDDASDRQVY